MGEGRLLLKFHEYRYIMVKHYPLLPSPQKKGDPDFHHKVFYRGISKMLCLLPISLGTAGFSGTPN